MPTLHMYKINNYHLSGSVRKYGMNHALIYLPPRRQNNHGGVHYRLFISECPLNPKCRRRYLFELGLTPGVDFDSDLPPILPCCSANSAKLSSVQAESGRQCKSQNQSQPNQGQRGDDSPCRTREPIFWLLGMQIHQLAMMKDHKEKYSIVLFFQPIIYYIRRGTMTLLLQSCKRCAKWRPSPPRRTFRETGDRAACPSVSWGKWPSSPGRSSPWN